MPVVTVSEDKPLSNSTLLDKTAGTLDTLRSLSDHLAL